MRYPGRVIKQGETDARIVKALKKQLNRRLALGQEPVGKLDPEHPLFGPETKRAVKLFQARHVDGEGRPLRQDGEVGSLSWEALFLDAPAPRIETVDDPWLARSLAVAAAEVGTLEEPRNSNRGARVETYLRSVGLRGGYAWCCAFTYFCADEAARQLGRTHPMVRTAGCMDHWRRAPAAGARRIAARDAVADPGLLRPGLIFIMDHGGGLGHTGLVEAVAGGLLHTIEGNTDASRSREGGGVYRLTRKVGEISAGYLDYSGLTG